MDQPASNPFAALSAAVADLVNATETYTVTVFGRKRLPATGIVWGQDVIVTANHVVERNEGIEVSSASGSRIAATVIGRDPASDIAVLRAEGLGLEPAPRANESLRAGEYVLAIGRAGEGHPRVSSGLINLADGAIRVSRGRVIAPIYQSEIAMLPGFSGGPLINASGEVVGINSSHLGRGMSLTVSIDVLTPIVDALSEYGRLRRGYIGVGAQAVGISAGQVKESGIDREIGLVVLSIDEGGPAHNAGLLIGDILIAVNRSAVGSVDDLVDQLPGELIGSQIPVQLLRGAQKQEINITVGERE